METIRFDQGDKNWKWAVCAIRPKSGEEPPPDWYENVRDNGLQITVTINGLEFQFSTLMKRIFEESERQVEKRAMELIKEKTNDLMHLFSRLTQLLEKKQKKLFPT
jgi:hypothetical protein